MGECAADDVQPPKQTRLQYGREEILAIKERALAMRLDADRLSSMYAMLKSNRGRAKANSTSKSQDRPKDAVNIVLGPQKRTWNTGCHVSQSINRESVESPHAPSRWSKFGSEHRPHEKPYSRVPSDARKDYRAVDSRGGYAPRGRDRVSSRHDGIPFARSFSREDRFCRDGRTSNSYSEDEPEWYSEGPATINETIELGGILEESVDLDSSFTRDNGKVQAKLTKLTEDINPAIIDPAIASSIPANNGFFPKLTTDKPPSPLTDSQGICNDSKPKESQGSRFKHLFTKNEPESDKQDDINKQLLKLLKGYSGNQTNVPVLERNNVVEVENKLRSILLGHTLPNSPAAFETKNVPTQEPPKGKVLTVEEIEAQLRLPKGDSPDLSKSRISADSRTVQNTENDLSSNKIAFNNSSTKYSQTDSTNNLVPILQTLMLKHQQQKPIYPQPRLQTPLNPFGILSGPMANAVSASARINQLQHSENPVTAGPDNDPFCQGVLRQIWNQNMRESQNAVRPSYQTSANLHQQPVCTTSFYTNGVLQNPPGYPHAQQPTDVQPNIPRRPIVKSAFPNHPSYAQPSVPGGASNSAEGIGSLDINRRLLSMALKQYEVGINKRPDGLDKSFPNHLSNHLPDYSGVSLLTSNPPSAISPIPVNHNNNATSFNTSQIRCAQMVSQPEGGNYNFFPHLSDLDQSKHMQNRSESLGLNMFFPGSKLKSLDELERQESTRHDSLFQ